MDENTRIDGKTPRAKWSQSACSISLIICLEDCKNPKININQRELSFEGVGGPQSALYKINVQFFKDVDPNQSQYLVRDREIELILKKKEQGPYWLRLLKTQVKQHWLGVDFERWKEEDESDEDNMQEQLSETELNEKRYGLPPIEKRYTQHISQNIAMGSSLCPLGSAIMGKAMKMEEGLNELSEKNGTSTFDINGFNEEGPDSDDEIISDIEEEPTPHIVLSS
jgi:prostaglandin-E synthase